MKNLIVAVSFATFSLGLPYAMAQQAIAQQAAAQDTIDVEKVVVIANEKEGRKLGDSQTC